jgi:hypothetical protein
MSNGEPGRASSFPSSSSRKASAGRHWVVPWVRVPAVGQIDECLAGEEVVAHVGHDPLDTRLVGRGPDSGGVDDEAPRLGVLEEHVVETRGGVLGLDDDRAHVVGNYDGEDPAEEPPGGLEAFDDLLGRLAEARPHELVTAVTRREDEPPAHTAPLAVGDEPEAAEVNLTLDSRRWVVDSHRRRAPARSTALHGKASECAMRDLDPPALEEYPDLHDRELVVHPVLDALFFCEQHPPRLTVAVGTVRADPFHQLADQLVGELALAAVAIEPELDSGGDVAPRCFAVDADPVRDRALAFTFQPTPQCLSYLDHRYLPECHRASSETASEAQPNFFSAGGGGCSGWSHDWQRGWSHAAGKTGG